MKPLKITMNAFGSYAGCQEIDFTKLGPAGLYLITGETGAGKTTIFDAISFALYGKASGTNRENYLMLRSDFAAEKTKTYVALDFISGDKQYSIKRLIKKSGQEAALLLPDGTVVSGGRSIGDKIAEIVGLDQKQFSQIVMIAQNDFLRFLQSGTDERVKIMRRIFGTERLRQLQEQLKQLVKSESDRRDFILHDFKRHDVDIYQRNEQFREWEAQIRTDKADLSAVNKKISEHDLKKQALAAGLAVAAELERKFADLIKCRNDFALHEAKALEMEEINLRASRGETALYQVKPLYDETQKAAANHFAAENGLKQAKDAETDALARADAAVQVAGSLPPLAKAQEALAALVKEWEAAASHLKLLSDLHLQRHEIDGQQKTLFMEQMGFESLDASFKKEDENHRAMEEAFLLSQAGILAQGLKTGSPCPVCGSCVHPAPAELSAADVTEEKLKKARDTKEKLRMKREKQSSACGILASAVETRKQRFIADFSVFNKDADWESSVRELDELLAQTRGRAEKLALGKETDEKALALLSADWENAMKRKASTEADVKAAQTLVSERAANEQKHKKLREETKLLYADALKAHHFIDEADFIAVLPDEKLLADLKKQASDYRNHGEQLKRDISRLETETAGKVKPDAEGLRSEQETVMAGAKALNIRRDEINSRLSRTEGVLKELRRAAADFEKAELSYAAVKQLTDTANGKLDFETYAQMAYFERVLRAANLRLKMMSQNRYILLRKTASDDGRKRAGLELEVLDAYTGKARSANSLSGGESFMASLSLALGLSDVVQHSAGGIRLDSMFIDEGFGSLDNDVLELAIRTLSEMAGANRIIGIISHVSELRERIDKQVQVEKTAGGSIVSLKV